MLSGNRFCACPAPGQDRFFSNGSDTTPAVKTFGQGNVYLKSAVRPLASGMGSSHPALLCFHDIGRYQDGKEQIPERTRNGFV